MPSHTHDFQNFYFAENNGNSGLPNVFAGSNKGTDGDNNPFYMNWTTYARGGNQGHNHSFTSDAINFAVQYIDVIICSKN